MSRNMLRLRSLARTNTPNIKWFVNFYIAMYIHTHIFVRWRWWVPLSGTFSLCFDHHSVQKARTQYFYSLALCTMSLARNLIRCNSFLPIFCFIKDDVNKTSDANSHNTHTHSLNRNYNDAPNDYPITITITMAKVKLEYGTILIDNNGRTKERKRNVVAHL